MRLLDPAHQADAIELAAQRLAEGGLVALPTETVYGLGARADRDEAVARIFAARGRPADHPLIVHVPNQAAALYFVTTFPPVAQRLVEAFWPGPLTVIVPRHPDMARAPPGGPDTLRLPCPPPSAARPPSPPRRGPRAGRARPHPDPPAGEPPLWPKPDAPDPEAPRASGTLLSH